MLIMEPYYVSWDHYPSNASFLLSVKLFDQCQVGDLNTEN